MMRGWADDVLHNLADWIQAVIFASIPLAAGVVVVFGLKKRKWPTQFTRRVLLALGAAFLIGGSGIKSYAANQQRRISAHVKVGPAWYLATWDTQYFAGYVFMTIGGGLIGFAILRPEDKDKHRD